MDSEAAPEQEQRNAPEVAQGESAEATPLAGTPAPETLPAAKQIYIFDDDVAFADSACEYFETRGVQLVIFNSKQMVLAYTFTESPALLVIDMDLNGEDGRGLALDLWDAGKLKNCPAVLLTDTAMEKDLYSFTLKLGFTKIMQKPVDFAVLERLIADEAKPKTSKTLQSPITRHVAVEPPTKIGEVSPPETKTSLKAPPATQPEREAPAARTTRQLPKKSVENADDVRSDFAKYSKGIGLGLGASALVAAILAIAVSKGYTHSLVVLEGLLLGLAGGIGLKLGWKAMTKAPLPANVMMAAGAVSLGGWAILLGLRKALGVPFIDYRPAVLKAMEDFPGQSFPWGVSEWINVAHIAGQLIIMFIVVTLFARSAGNVEEKKP